MYAATASQALFADCVRGGRNTLLVGAPGTGKTSALHMTEFDLRESDRPVAYVSLAPAEDVGHATVAIYRAAAAQGWLEADDDLVDAALRTDDPYAPNALIRQLGSAPDDAVILVDDVHSEVGHGLFGRLRDELWQYGLVWGVAADSSEAHGLRRPPADAFFEEVVHLESPAAGERRALLRRRAGREGMPLTDTAIDALAEYGAASLRDLLAAARQVTVSGLQPQTVVIGTERRRRRAEEAGGRPAAMLVSEMEHLGPVSAGDEQLLDALGWTRPRAVDLLNQLEAAGVVRSHVERRDGPGRPRKLYELRPATEFVA